MENLNKREDLPQDIPESTPGPTMQEQIDQEMARRQAVKVAEAPAEQAPSPADNPVLKEAIARQREKLKAKIAGRAAVVPPPVETAVVEDLPILEEVDPKPVNEGEPMKTELVGENPGVDPIAELSKPEEKSDTPKDQKTEEVIESLEALSSGKPAQERAKENVTALEEMRGAVLGSAENAEPAKEEKPITDTRVEAKAGTGDIEEQAYKWVSGPAEPTAKVEEKPKTLRERSLELDGQIEELDQKIKEGKEKKKHFSELGSLAVAEAGPGVETDLVTLQTEKEACLKELKDIEYAKKLAKEKAFEVLSAPDVMKMNPREVAESFGDFTENEKGERRHLEKESSEMAYKNERERGMTVLVGPEAIEAYRQRAIMREEEKIHAEERSSAMATCWERLSEKERKQFKAADSPEFKNYLDQKRQKLGISENSFAGLVKMGYRPEAAKTRSWFGRLFYRDAIEIPTSNPNIFLGSDGSKDDINKWVEDNHNRSVKEDAAKRVDLRIIEGRHRLLREKAFCTKQIIAQVVEPHGPEKSKPQEEPIAETPGKKEGGEAGAQNEEEGNKKKKKKTKVIKLPPKRSPRRVAAERKAAA
jgi:hypothetical protein